MSKNKQVIARDCTDEVPEAITVGCIHSSEMGLKLLRFLESFFFLLQN